GSTTLTIISGRTSDTSTDSFSDIAKSAGGTVDVVIQFADLHEKKLLANIKPEKHDVLYAKFAQLYPEFIKLENRKDSLKRELQGIFKSQVEHFEDHDSEYFSSFKEKFSEIDKVYNEQLQTINDAFQAQIMALKD